MRKRILSLLIACSMLAAVGTGISAYAAEVDSGLSSGNNVLSQSSASEIDKKIYDDFEYVTYESQNHSKVHITSYLGNNSSVVFPNTIEGKPVVSIEIYYYLNGEENTTVKSVTVPANCESCRFDNFAALEEIKVNSGNSKYKSVNGVLIAKDKTEFCYPRNNKATSFAIPENVTWVKSNAFFKCKNLTSVTVNDKASLIGGSGGGCGLSTCPNMKEIKVSSKNENYCDVDGVLFNKDKTSIACYPGGLKGAYSIPEGVDAISVDAFYACDGLTSVHIPKTVTMIGGIMTDMNFKFCPNLTEISVDENNEHIYTVDGVLFWSDTLVAYPAGKKGNYILPENIRATTFHGFGGCKNLTALAVPNADFDVTSGGWFESPEDTPFIGCDNLTIYGVSGSKLEEHAKQHNIPFKPISEYPDNNSSSKNGDLDGDNKITAADALLVLRASVGLEKFNDEQNKLADVDGSGKVDSADSLSILRWSVGLKDKGILIEL